MWEDAARPNFVVQPSPHPHPVQPPYPHGRTCQSAKFFFSFSANFGRFEMCRKRLFTEQAAAATFRSDMTIAFRLPIICLFGRRVLVIEIRNNLLFYPESNVTNKFWCCVVISIQKLTTLIG